MMDYKEIEPYLSGQWEDILNNYGIDLPRWQGKNTINAPCPCCGGDDRSHWRRVDNGRIALFCRGCAAESMKSTEQVIMELTGVSFAELCREIGQFAGMMDDKKLTITKAVASSYPKFNMPKTHRQDAKKSIEMLDKSKDTESNAILLRNGIQYPYSLPEINGYPIFKITDASGNMINLALIDSDSRLKYLAGGMSYGGIHTIPPCEQRKTNQTTYTTKISTAIKHWYKTGDTVICVFDIYNLIWMRNHNLIHKKSVIELNSNEQDLYCIE